MYLYRAISILCGIGLLATIATMLLMFLALIGSSLIPQGLIDLVDSFGSIIPFGRTAVALLSLCLIAELFCTVMVFAGRFAARSRNSE